MNLFDLGLTDKISDYLKDTDLKDFIIGRVTREYRERYTVSTGEMEYNAEITGNLRFTASSRADFPAVGDWVAMSVYDSDQAIIHRVLPRKSLLERQMVGKAGEKQIISANIDVAFIIQSIDNNFNINRLERYMTVCYSSGIEPVLVISKVDLSTETEIKTVIDSLEKRNKKIKTILLSNITYQGLDQILNYIEKGKTYCVVGSSGVGKSTLINKLLGNNVLKTGHISQSTNKGRHITEHRELFILDNGGIVIDTPGMKELGVTEDNEGLQTAFQEISDLALKCRFSDCTHVNEIGCAVIRALNDGIINRDSLENFRRLLKEQERFTLSIAEKRKKDREFGKMAKNIMKEKKKTKG